MVTSSECPANYTYNPGNDYTLLRYKELTKGNYAPVKGLEETTVIPEIEDKQSSSTNVNNESGSRSKSSSKTSSSNSKQEAVQLYPQEINLKLRISEYMSQPSCLIIFYLKKMTKIFYFFIFRRSSKNKD